MIPETPYSRSKERVLILYREHRQRGAGPAVAILRAKQDIEQALMMVTGQLTPRTLSMVEWDRYHVERYYRQIRRRIARRSTYWARP
jgi:hypothetical protein